MTTKRMPVRQGMGRYALFGSLLVLSLVALVAPQLSAQSRTWRECVDDALLDYNQCLMEAGTSFSKTICDLAWEFETVRCTAEAIGDIRRAFNGG